MKITNAKNAQETVMNAKMMSTCNSVLLAQLASNSQAAHAVVLMAPTNGIKNVGFANRESTLLKTPVAKHVQQKTVLNAKLIPEHAAVA
jgi:hypothetical protein